MGYDVKTVADLLRQLERAVERKRVEPFMERISASLKARGVAPEKAQYERKQYAGETKEISDEDRTVTAFISTVHLDRQGDVVIPEGALLDNYLANPVTLWCHSYEKFLPTGRNLWLKVLPREGILAKTQYLKNQIASDVWECKREGLLAYSIGYIVVRAVTEKNAVLDEMKRAGIVLDGAVPDRVLAEWELLEYSDVLVPANPHAKDIASKFISLPMREFFANEVRSVEAETKRALPYHDHGQAPEGAVWDAARQVKDATVDDLRIMCAWYDVENRDAKSSYKLPHHRLSDYKSVWRGVAAAMSALLGARGGVDIPDDDRKAVYNHLAKEYKAHGKEAPDFKAYSPEELDEMFKACEGPEAGSSEQAGDGDADALDGGEQSDVPPEGHEQTHPDVHSLEEVRTMLTNMASEIRESLDRINTRLDAIEQEVEKSKAAQKPNEQKRIVLIRKKGGKLIAVDKGTFDRIMANIDRKAEEATKRLTG